MMTVVLSVIFLFFFFKQKTAYEMRISDWSSDVCSSDLDAAAAARAKPGDRCHGVLAPDLPAGVAEVAGAVAGPEEVEQKHVDEIGRASCRERVCQYV